MDRGPHRLGENIFSTTGSSTSEGNLTTGVLKTEEYYRVRSRILKNFTMNGGMMGENTDESEPRYKTTINLSNTQDRKEFP